jgi:hypothetical protein
MTAHSSQRNIRRIGIAGAVLWGTLALTLTGAGQEAPPKASDDFLRSMNMCPYPAKSDIKDRVLEPGMITGRTLSEARINEDFSNLDDLKWLEPIAKSKRVLLYGELHYYQVIQYLRDRILFALNTYDYYPLLVIERQYSITGYLDHYIGLADDREAEAFRRAAMEGLVTDVEEFGLLTDMRRWNKLHPAKRIHIGASDVEHDFKTTLRRVIVPYFRKADPGFAIDLDAFVVEDLESLVPALRKKLAPLAARGFVGDYPFLTASYIECVLDNLYSIYLSRRYDFNYNRQKAIVRNLTDPRFLGRYLAEGKVMIHGGEWHTPSRFPYPDGGNFYREGSYLSYDYGPTKGKTYAITVKGMALQFGPMAGLDLGRAVPHGGSYNYCINQFQAAYKQKLVTPDGYYFMKAGLSDADRFFMAVAYEFDHKPLLIQRFDWPAAEAKAKKISDRQARAVADLKDYLERYDATIVVFRSPILRAVMKGDQ